MAVAEAPLGGLVLDRLSGCDSTVRSAAGNSDFDFRIVRPLPQVNRCWAIALHIRQVLFRVQLNQLSPRKAA